MTRDKTLAEVLGALGYTYRPSSRAAVTGARDIIDATGAVAFTGTAWKAWAWLKETGQWS